MKTIKLTIIALLALTSCTKPEYKRIGQEIIDGKVSAIKYGKTASYGSPPISPKIWVQTPTKTVQIELPFEYENRWKVGDSCLLIIEKFKVIKLP